ncbi:MAG: hypothetical protein EOO54_25255 [Haliea sp.]|nr:MAG: hypothetical protein EOO54_25255 [Haliea sp.]
MAGLLAACFLALPAWAAEGIEEKLGLLGMGRQALEASLDGAERARARRLPSGAVAQLRQADVAFGPGRFEQTFFFAQQRLVQIELVSLPETAGANLFNELVMAMRQSLGPELAAGDSASWVHQDADVLLFRYGDPTHPAVRIVVRQRQLVDAGEL